MGYVIDPPVQAHVAVAGTDDLWPVRRIFCVGRNYAAHAREMGKDPDRDPPFFFTKPADAAIGDGETVAYPPMTEDFHYEAELVVAIGKTAMNVPEAQALDHVWGYGVGNDLTRRDLQWDAKDTGRPWDMSKGFDRSAVVGPLHAASDVGHLSSGAIRLTQNGTVKQDADLADLIWSVPEIVSYLSQFVVLQPGDLIMTGTPAGVGAMQPGDVVTVSIEGLGAVTTTIGPKA